MNPYNYINKFVKFGTKGGYKPGLKRIKALLEPFGSPENKLNIIHVAGSNGKGSTIAYLKSIYIEAGYKVGVYTSPHLLEFNERMEINGVKITSEELQELICLLQPVVEKIKESELGEPSFFEIVTALAFLYFYRQRVDILLLEVGLGGRLDATNVILSPLISVITSISLEHTSILGNTVQQIAREKAGIIKTGSPVVVGVKDREALELIESVADEKGSRLIKWSEWYDYIVNESSLEGQSFSLILRQRGVEESMVKRSLEFEDKYLPGTYLHHGEGYRVSMLGEYQIQNAVLALAVVEQLNHKFKIEKNILKNGLINAFIPGRTEIIKRKPLVIVDGAHNTDGMAVFVSFIKDLIKKQLSDKGSFYIILALLGDKDSKGILQEIANIENMELIISQNENGRALSAETIKSQADILGINSRAIVPLSLALKKIVNNAGSDDIICIVGSLYNIYQVRKSFNNN